MADFDGDGNPDLLFHNKVTRTLEVWFMNGSSFSHSKAIQNSLGNPVIGGLGWRLVGTGHFWKDSSNPRIFGILWQNQNSRALAVWYLTGADKTQLDGTALLPNASPGWWAGAVGDFDGDGHSDIAFQHDTTGQKAIWLLDTASLNIKPNGTIAYNNPPKWRLTGTGDFGSGGDPASGIKDGKDDLVFTYYDSENDTIGVNQVGIWFMDGLTLVYPTAIKNSSGQTVVPELPDWRFVATGTFDADSKTDVFIRDAVIGRQGIWHLSGYVFQAGQWVKPQPDPAWKLFSQDWLHSAWRHKEIYPSISGYVSSTSPLQFTLSYRIAPNDSYGLTIRRRLAEGTWSTLVSGYTSDTFTDTSSLTAGVRYEYEVRREGSLPLWMSPTRFFARIFMSKAQPITLMENRGKVIVVVDGTVYNGIASPLEIFKRDLISDGWTVVLKTDAPRHIHLITPCDAGRYRTDPSADAANKTGRNIVKQFIDSHPDAKGVILVGHVTVPLSGWYPVDSHGDSSGAAVADVWYGHSGAGWTDNESMVPCPESNPYHFPSKSNVADDGKFDNDRVPFPEQLTKFVGRIDFSRMPTFGTGDEVTLAEINLLNSYFAKNHAYRRKHTVFNNKAVAYLTGPHHSYAHDNELLLATAFRNMSPLFESGFENFTIGDAYHQKTDSYLWGIRGGGGGVDTISWGMPGNHPLEGPFLQHNTLGLLNSESKVAFYILYGSYMFDWPLPDNFIRASIAGPSYGLAAAWIVSNPVAFPSHWQFQGMAFGEPIGHGLLQTIRHGEPGTSDHSRVLSIFGDPTLRMWVVDPPYIVYWWNDALNWSGGEPGSQFYIYHAADMESAFTRIAGPLSGNSYSGAPTTGVLMVRAAKSVTTGSGTFVNFSQGTIYP
jgi:hypothetical protein